jgi:hypothetical protein
MDASKHQGGYHRGTGGGAPAVPGELHHLDLPTARLGARRCPVRREYLHGRDRHHRRRRDLETSRHGSRADPASWGTRFRGVRDPVRHFPDWPIYSPAGFFHGLGKIYLTRDGGCHWHFITP